MQPIKTRYENGGDGITLESPPSNGQIVGF